MTAEVSFAKSFLSMLDSRPIKLQADYAIEPKEFEIKGPYTLPRLSHSMKRPEKVSAPGSDPAITVSLKSLKNPPLDLALPAQPLTTSVLDLKQKVVETLQITGTDKVRLLYKKKPCTDSKTLKDLLGEDTPAAVELSVMVIGGVPENSESSGGTKAAEAPAAVGDSGTTVMASTEFWDDLRGFLEQRVKDQRVAKQAALLFEEVWKEKGSA